MIYEFFYVFYWYYSCGIVYGVLIFYKIKVSKGLWIYFELFDFFYFCSLDFLLFEGEVVLCGEVVIKL